MKVIIFLATAWGMSNGGINTFNYQLCKAFANEFGKKVRVVCVSYNISANERRNMKQQVNLDLVSMSTEKDFMEHPEEIVNKLLSDKIIESGSQVLWVGHDIHTGFIACKCRERVKGSKVAIIHHMAYKEYYSMMSDNEEKIMDKEKKQEELLRNADYIFANGPKLYESAQNLCEEYEGEKIFQILPGLSDITPQKNPPTELSAIVFGRIEEKDKNNAIIKQPYLAVAAWGRYLKKIRDEGSSISSRMYVVGYDKDRISEANRYLKKFVEGYTKGAESISACSYLDHDNLHRILRKQSLSFMLSREEGFGLAGMEAISAGVPVVISHSSGLYQFLKQNRLENLVMHIPVEGSYEFPFFSSRDLECGVLKIGEYNSNKKEWKQNALRLKNELKKLDLTWEHCAADIMSHSNMGIVEHIEPISKSDVSQNVKKKTSSRKGEKRVFEEIKSGFEIQYFEDADIRKWFRREKIYKILDQKTADNNWSILLVSGPKGSGKARTIYYWLRTNNIESKQIIYLDAENIRDANIIRDQWELFCKKKQVSFETNIYLFIDNCGNINSYEYYDIFIRLIRENKNLKLIAFNNKKFQQVALLQECCDVELFQLGSFGKMEVKKYLRDIFRIKNLTDEDIEKLKCTGYNAEQIRKFVEYIHSGLDFDSSAKRFEKIDYPRSIDDELVNSLSEDEKKIAGLFSMFEYTFSKKEAKRIQEIFDLKECQLIRLLQSNILIDNSKSNYRIQPIYRRYFIEQLNKEERQRACLEIAGYYERTYKYGLRNRRESITDLLCGIEACKYYQKIGEYEKVNELLDRRKVYRKAIVSAYYQSILEVMHVQYEKRDSLCKDCWNIYRYVFSLVRVGQFVKAEKVIMGLDPDKIEPKECRTALFRLNCEIKYEHMSATEVLDYIEIKSGIWNGNAYNTSDSQLSMFKAQLLIIEQRFEEVERICNNNFVEPDQIDAKTPKQIKYNTAVAGTIKLIMQNERGDKIDHDFMNKIEKLFCELQDIRGISWFFGIKGEIVTREGDNGDEFFKISIENRSRMLESAKEYKLWLNKIRNMISDEELRGLADQEIKRLSLQNS